MSFECLEALTSPQAVGGTSAAAGLVALLLVRSLVRWTVRLILIAVVIGGVALLLMPDTRGDGTNITQSTRPMDSKVPIANWGKDG